MFRRRKPNTRIDRLRFPKFNPVVDKGQDGQKSSQGRAVTDKSRPSRPGGGARGVMAFRRAEKGDGCAVLSQLCQKASHSACVRQVKKQAADDRIVAFFPAFGSNGKVFFPEGKGGVDLAGSANYLGHQRPG